MRQNQRPPSGMRPSFLARQKPVEFRPYIRRIAQNITRMRGGARGSGAHRNAALRIDEKKPAFIGQIVADEDRLAAGKKRVRKQGGDAVSLVVTCVLEFGDHFAWLHG